MKMKRIWLGLWLGSALFNIIAHFVFKLDYNILYLISTSVMLYSMIKYYEPVRTQNNDPQNIL